MLAVRKNKYLSVIINMFKTIMLFMLLSRYYIQLYNVVPVPSINKIIRNGYQYFTYIIKKNSNVYFIRRR